MDIVKSYEVPFMKKLENSALIADAYIQPFNRKCPTCRPYTTLKKGSPLIKRKVFSEALYCENSLFLLYLLLYKNRALMLQIESYFLKKIYVILIEMLIKRLENFVFNKVEKEDKIKIKIFNIAVLKYMK